MIKIKNKFFIYLLVCWVTFSTVYVTYQKSYAYAIEWAGVTIGLDTALKFLLGLVGISAGVGVAEQIDWGQTRQDCMAFQQNQGNSAVAVSEWWSDVADGTLDKASSCWTSFKEWASSLVSTSSPSIPSGGCIPFEEAISVVNNHFNGHTTVSNIPSDIYVYAIISDGTSDHFTHFIIDPCEITLDDNGTHISTNTARFCSFNFKEGTIYNPSFSSGGYFPTSWSPIYRDDILVGLYNVAVSGTRWIDHTFTFDISGTVNPDIPVVNRLFQAIDNSVINNLDIINQGDTVIEGDTVINLPWERVGDDSLAVDDVVQGLIDKVNEGLISLENYVEQIHNITNTYVYDTTNNYIFPNDEDETIDDKINENKSNEGFTLFGLERFFPFCIPWDLYAFLGILEADPVAPNIPVPMPNISSGEIDVYYIDLSPLEGVAMVLRYGFDFMFIIGLALATRRLIGAGGD